MIKFRTHLYLTALALLTLLFLLTAAINLPNFFPVSADDAWIMSASYKLANEGVFGSNLYAGFFNAEKHYFIALPVYHFLQAAVFKLAGFGLAQARLPNLFSAIGLIWITYSLARRQYGRKTALLTAALLIFWRSDLTATEPRVPLLAYAHSGRYDITAAFLVWMAVWLLDHFQRRPRPRIALALGLTAGLATLTQFFGVFILPPIALLFWHKWPKNLLKQRPVQLFTLTFLLTILPYAAYTLAHLEDFIGQSTLKGQRVDFLEPAFYLENILREPERYATLLQRQHAALTGGGEPLRPFGPWLLTITVITAVCCLFYLLWRRKASVWPTVWFSLLCFVGCLTLFDQTKAPVYAILLLPGVCLALAVFCKMIWQRLWQVQPSAPLRIGLVLPLVVFLAVIILEGANSHRRMIILARETTPYQTVGRRIEAAVRPGAAVLGSERWWPALKDYPYLALNNIWARWLVADQAGLSPDFVEQVKEYSAEFIVINNNITGDINFYPAQLQTQFWDYLTFCGTLVSDWQDNSYGRIQIYRLSPDCGS